MSEVAAPPLAMQLGRSGRVAAAIGALEARIRESEDTKAPLKTRRGCMALCDSFADLPVVSKTTPHSRNSFTMTSLSGFVERLKQPISTECRSLGEMSNETSSVEGRVVAAGDAHNAAKDVLAPQPFHADRERIAKVARPSSSRWSLTLGCERDVATLAARAFVASLLERCRMPRLQPSLRWIPVALLFPNQAPSLMGTLAGDSGSSLPLAARALLRRASSFLGFDVEELCAQGPAKMLDQTQYCQPAVYVASLCAAEKLRVEQPDVVERCQAVAGFGVGEYAALCLAGVFDFELGLRLVRLRAEAMHVAATASPAGSQQQLMLRELELDQIEELCETVRKETGEVCGVAYAMMPKVHICAGTKAAAERLFALGVEHGAKANFLDTPHNLGYGAFQTSLMQCAQIKLKAALRAAVPSMRPPRCSVYFNASGVGMPAGSDPIQVAELLAAQLTSTVLWQQTIRGMLDEGVDKFVVCGPTTAKQLKDVMRGIGGIETWRNTAVSCV